MVFTSSGVILGSGSGSFTPLYVKLRDSTFCIDHNVAFPPSSLAACVVASTFCGAANRLGVVSTAATAGPGDSSFFGTEASVFEVCCVVFIFWRAALAAAPISALASTKVLPSARCEST